METFNESNKRMHASRENHMPTATKKTEKKGKTIVQKKHVVSIPAGIAVVYEHGNLKLSKGNKAAHKQLATPEVAIKVEGQDVHFIPRDSKRKTFAVLNALMAHTQNLIVGVEKGFFYKLSVVHSHFPMNIAKKESRVEISNFLGEKAPRIAAIIGKDTQVDIKGKEITVKGPNKEDVAQTAANMEVVTREKQKDQRVFQDGIYIVASGVNA
jgi:large subunit ribosomal protein L6